ncbi:MAG TPA: PepSY domain-containing protein [Thalassobaculum sp.]
MIRNTFAAALVAGTLAVAGVAATGAAVAQQAGNTATAPATPAMLPVETVLQQLGAQGYRDFTGFELDDGKYEVEGRDAEGRGVEIDVDAKTGEILKVEQD